MTKRSKVRQASGKAAMAVSTAADAAANTQSHVVITGMASPVLKRLSAIPGAKPLVDFSAEGLSAAVVVFEGALADIEATLKEQSEAQVFAVYQAPWDAVVSVSEDRLPNYLPEWLSYHSGLLRLRQHSGGRLQLMNAKRLDDSAQLLFEEICSVSGQASVLGGEMIRPADDAPDAHAVLRAKSFEWMAPEYWDVYEALESCAWLGNGEPEYRDGLPALDLGDLAEVVTGWRHALHSPKQLKAVQAELSAVREQASQSAERANAREQELLASLRERNEAAGKAERALTEKVRVAEELASESRADADALLAQLHRVQESLEASFLRGQSAANRTTEVINCLEQEKVRAKEAETLNANLADKLKAELAALEKQRATVLAEKSKLAAESAKLREDLSKAERKLELAETERRQQAQKSVALETRVKEAEVDAGLLLQQLHHVQDELDHYFVRNRRVTAELRDSTESCNRARRVVVQLMKAQSS